MSNLDSVGLGIRRLFAMWFSVGAVLIVVPQVCEWTIRNGFGTTVLPMDVFMYRIRMCQWIGFAVIAGGLAFIGLLWILAQRQAKEV